MESAFGADLAAVRLHTDPTAAEEARRRDAAAFTLGTDVFFAAGRLSPHTAAGQRLLAHEVAHVLQQRAGAAPDHAARYGAGERESDAAADAVQAGGRARVAQRTGGLVQHQHAGVSAPQLMPPSQLQLHLDPEIEAMMLQHYLRWWIGTSLVLGSPPAQATGAAAPVTPAAGALFPSMPTMPLSPDLFRPLPPDVLYAAPDMAAVLAPYNLRSVALGARDVDAATAIYRKNVAFVRLLPDLRSLAPSFIRPLIPGDWRRSMAASLTAATIDAQLQHDYPTPIEVSDQVFRTFAGVSTTTIPLPSISF